MVDVLVVIVDVLNFMLFACLVWYWLLESDLVMKHFRGGGEFDGNFTSSPLLVATPDQNPPCSSA